MATKSKDNAPARPKLSPELQAAVNDIRKAHGEESILLGSEISQEAHPRMTSGSLSLDAALGGGWPCNKWNEIYGDESQGKTTLILKSIAANQALDPEFMTLWIAAEDFIPQWAETLGVDLTRVIIRETNVMEDAFNDILRFLDTKAIDCIVVDSLPALVPGDEAEKLMEEFSVGLGARLIGKFFRKQQKNIRRSLMVEERPVLCFMVNQFREKIGVMYGDNRTTPGGKAKNFFYFTRVEVRRDEWITLGGGDRGEKIGQVIKARTIKNKTFPREKVATIDFYFQDGNGFHAGDYDTVKEMVALGINLKVFKRRGAYYDYLGGGEVQTWQGQAAMVAQLREDVDLYEEVSKVIMSRAANPAEVPTDEDDDPDPEPPPRRRNQAAPAASPEKKKVVRQRTKK